MKYTELQLAEVKLQARKPPAPGMLHQALTRQWLSPHLRVRSGEVESTMLSRMPPGGTGAEHGYWLSDVAPAELSSASKGCSISHAFCTERWLPGA